MDKHGSNAEAVTNLNKVNEVSRKNDSTWGKSIWYWF